MEAMAQHPTDTVQRLLLQEYCREAKGQIVTAQSQADAARIKEDWCNRFRKECESKILINAASAYLDTIIAGQWNEAWP